MKGWTETSLDKLCTLKRGHDLPSQQRIQGTIPVYSSSGVSGYHNQGKCSGPGVIAGRYGTIGKIFYANEGYWPLNTTLYVEDFHGNDEKFVYYLLKTLDWEQFNDKSAVPGINRNDVHKEIVKYPSPAEQRAIASVLSSLDDKIDLLHRQNATLEGMAEALFRQWFVVEAKEEWKTSTLGELCAISSGKSLKKEDFSECGGYPVLGANGKIGKCNKFLYEEKLIYTGRVGTLGKLFILNEKAWLSDNTLVFTNIKWFYFIYFTLTLSHLEDYDVGSTQPLIRQSDIKSIDIALPDKWMLEYFENLCEIIFSKISSNQQQIRTLEKLRDTLLPKLMSGEVRVDCTDTTPDSFVPNETTLVAMREVESGCAQRVHSVDELFEVLDADD